MDSPIAPAAIGATLRVCHGRFDGFKEIGNSNRRLTSVDDSLFQKLLATQNLFAINFNNLPPTQFNYRKGIERRTKRVDSKAVSRKCDAILLLDGIFVHRPELSPYWDFSIFLDTRFDVSIPRTARRGGGSPEVEAEGNRRYILGQRLYLAECDPKSLATIVVDNDDPESPNLASI